MGKNKFKKIILLSLISMCIVVYQNCSNVQLMEMPQEVLSMASEGGFCSAGDDSINDVLNVTFIVDMSGSNISLGSNPGTDNPGLRFDVIKDFINNPCVNKNPANKFSVIGFSASSFGTCSATSLGSPTQALAQLENLRNLQNNENPNSPTNMTETYYRKGIDCALGIMQSHITTVPLVERSKNVYMTFFLTDGLPTDYPNYDIEALKKDLEPKLDNMSAIGNTQAGGFRLQSILYGENKLPNPSVNLPKAHNILDWISGKGDSYRVSVNAVADIKFCELLASGKKTRYSVKDVGVINLTARMSKGKLLADSDMDGLPDDYEASYGFDPRRARSRVGGNELLDGLCPKGMPASSCSLSVNCGRPNMLGMTKCDQGAYGLTDAVDSDQDYIPDIVEILKGSSPNQMDRMSNIDGDSLPVYREIAYGRDPNYADDGVPENYLMSYQHELLSTPLPGCPANQESWKFTIDNLPLVGTKANIQDDPISLALPQLAHAEGENVILVYYIVRKANENQNLPSTAVMYGQFIRVNVNDPIVRLGSFVKLGEANGTFKPIP